MSERVLELLRRAVVILEEEIAAEAPPTPIRQFQAGEDEITLEGTLGKVETQHVGVDNIPLLKASLKVRTPEGPEKWIRIQAWRKVAVYAANNFQFGQPVLAIGKWDESQWTDRDTGEVHTNRFFSARLIQAA